MSSHRHGLNDPKPEVLFSMDALRRAWHLVRRNGSTPGSDFVKLADFQQNLEAELDRLRREILQGTYQPQPVRRYYKQKASGKNRPLSIWAFRDRVAQRVVHDYLTPILERHFLDCSYGFRPGKSVEDVTRDILAARDKDWRWVLDADITECFDRIPTDLLMSQVRSVVPSHLAQHLVYLWLKTPVKGHRGEQAGVSQGSVISPQLANLYLHRFDEMILAALPEARLFRFADDFLILCRHKGEAYWSLKVAKRCLANLRLWMNMDKTRIVHFEEGFEFLGVVFKGNRHTFPDHKQ